MRAQAHELPRQKLGGCHVATVGGLLDLSDQLLLLRVQRARLTLQVLVPARDVALGGAHLRLDVGLLLPEEAQPGHEWTQRAENKTK